MMWSDQSWRDVRVALATTSHLIAALQKRLESEGRDGLLPADAVRALRPIEEALDGAVAAAEWDDDE